MDAKAEHLRLLKDSYRDFIYRKYSLQDQLRYALGLEAKPPEMAGFFQSLKAQYENDKLVEVFNSDDIDRELTKVHRRLYGG